MKLLLVIFTLVCISGCSGLKYGPPQFEGCIILVDAMNNDKASCGCIDYKVNSVDAFNDYFLPSIRKRMVDHPDAQEVIDGLVANYKSIIKTHEYILPIFACRGYKAVSAMNEAKLKNWAEDNRVKRIKCESDLDDQW